MLKYLRFRGMNDTRVNNTLTVGFEPNPRNLFYLTNSLLQNGAYQNGDYDDALLNNDAYHNPSAYPSGASGGPRGASQPSGGPHRGANSGPTVRLFPHALGAVLSWTDMVTEPGNGGNTMIVFQNLHNLTESRRSETHVTCLYLSSDHDVLMHSECHL
jgi:hypothetical protein